MYAISIIVPTLNEEDNIDILLKRIFSIQFQHSIKLEILFSDGGSSDNTCRKVESWMQINPQVRLVTNPPNSGLSSSVLKAARAASGDYLVVMDADLSHPTEKLQELIQPLIADEADMVIGSRYVRGGETPEWPLSRRLSSLLATLPARLLTDVKDPLAGFIATRKSCLLALEHEVPGFKFGLELLATSERWIRVKEVPIRFTDRQHGVSKMSGRVVLAYGKQLLRLAGVFPAPFGVRHTLQVLLTLVIVDSTLLTFLVEHGFHHIRAGWISFLAAVFAGGFFAIVRQPEGGKFKDGNSLTAAHSAGMLWVMLLVMCLRSGLMETFHHDQSLSTVNIFAVVLFTLLALYIGSVFFVFSIGRKRVKGNLVHRLYALGIILYLLTLRLAYLGGLELLPDERHYLELIASSGSLAEGLSLPAPALGGYLASTVFGVSTFSLRIAAWFFAGVAAVCIFNFARDLYDRTTGFKTLLVFSVLPYFFGTGLFLTRDSVLCMFWSGLVYILFRAMVGKLGAAWLWGGVVLGFGLQSAPILALLLPAIALYVVLQRQFERDQLYSMALAVAIGLLTLLPGMMLRGTDGDASSYTEKYWLLTLLGPDLVQSLFLSCVLLSPTAVLAGLMALYGWVEGKGLVLGQVYQNKRATRTYVTTLFLVPLLGSLIPFSGVDGGVYGASIVWVVLMPSISLCAAESGERTDEGLFRHLRGAWWPTIVILVTAYALLLNFSVV